MKRIIAVFVQAVPILLMIALIPLIENDYVLTGIYILIIAGGLSVGYEKRDCIFLVFGFIVMTLSELLFISTGVETFMRESLFGLMPLWLPFLWAYAFVVMKRSMGILKWENSRRFK